MNVVPSNNDVNMLIRIFNLMHLCVRTKTWFIGFFFFSVIQSIINTNVRKYIIGVLSNFFLERVMLLEATTLYLYCD